MVQLGPSPPQQQNLVRMSWGQLCCLITHSYFGTPSFFLCNYCLTAKVAQIDGGGGKFRPSCARSCQVRHLVASEPTLVDGCQIMYVICSSHWLQVRRDLDPARSCMSSARGTSDGCCLVSPGLNKGPDPQMDRLMAFGACTSNASHLDLHQKVVSTLHNSSLTKR